MDTVIVSRVLIAGTLCEELGRHVNMSLLCLLLRLVRARYFAH
jgi:hypothetical protein